MSEKKSEIKKITIKIRRISYTMASMLFIVTLTALFAVSLDFPDRPSFSENEKRELAKFPEFSFGSLFNGDYFNGINSWFSDTFPFRDSLIKCSSDIKRLMGMSNTIHNFSENKADVIPDAEMTSQETADVQVQIPESSSSNDLLKPALPVGNKENSTSSQNSGNDIIEQKFDSIYVYGNTAYEYYNFVQSTADNYVAAINSAANESKSYGINFYNMIIPTSTDITLNESTRKKLNSSDQKNAINYMTSKMNDNVKTVAVFDLLKAHKDEYIYFRTDHHWTSLGAYYAYAQFMTVKGGKYEPLSNFTEYSFNDFLGTFYNDTGKNQALEKTPDVVYAYVPPYSNTFKMKEKGASEYLEWPIICDVTNYSQSYKYLCFIGGDNPISVIENKDIENGETCVFVKESFGNAFAPYLTCNYKYVYIVDYRYFDSDIVSFAKEKGATDIIVQNNISMTRNKDLVNKLSEML